MGDFPAYHVIDTATWPRREHFAYYRREVRCGYSLTSRMDVADMLSYSRRSGRRFYGCFLYAVSRTVNSMESMRMMIPPEGGVGIWDRVHPSFTIFHEDDHTFSDVWMEYSENFDAFYREFVRVMEKYGQNHGIKARAGQPANFFCASCAPWINFDGYSTWVAGSDEPALFPIITCGQYAEESGDSPVHGQASEGKLSGAGGRVLMPVNLTISHAAADGWHAGVFFEKLRENFAAFRERELLP